MHTSKVAPSVRTRSIARPATPGVTTSSSYELTIRIGGAAAEVRGSLAASRRADAPVSPSHRPSSAQAIAAAAKPRSTRAPTVAGGTWRAAGVARATPLGPQQSQAGLGDDERDPVPEVQAG